MLGVSLIEKFTEIRLWSERGILCGKFLRLFFLSTALILYGLPAICQQQSAVEKIEVKRVHQQDSIRQVIQFKDRIPSKLKSTNITTKTFEKLDSTISKVTSTSSVNDSIHSVMNSRNKVEATVAAM